MLPNESMILENGFVGFERNHYDEEKEREKKQQQMSPFFVEVAPSGSVDAVETRQPVCPCHWQNCPQDAGYSLPVETKNHHNRNVTGSLAQLCSTANNWLSVLSLILK